MPWPLRLIPDPQRPCPACKGPLCYSPADGCTNPEFHIEQPKVGDCWYSEGYRSATHLGKIYKTQHAAHRAPILIVLPASAGWWCPDCMAYDRNKGHHGDGWQVTGTLPNVTITPSINAIGSYHGWVRAGVLTDDCERHGAAQPPAPKAPPPGQPRREGFRPPIRRVR